MTELKGIDEVKTMLRTSLKRYSKKLIDEGMQKGLVKGIETGIEKGTLQAKQETARALLKEGMTVEKISEITGLDIDAIKK